MWKEMEKLVDEGLCETIGVSNFSENEIEEILAICRIKPAGNQVSGVLGCGITETRSTNTPIAVPSVLH